MAHESALRSLALTADGLRLATASEKGTVIRVFDVTTAICLHEFRRGFERATITCLAWSWDSAWLACTSDKGTSHVFQLEVGKDEEKKTNDTAASLTQMIFSSVRKSVEGDARKSVYQIRGVPHPKACAFIGEANHLQLAVAGWDADGNGVLLVSEFAAGDEPKRIGYHVLCRSEQTQVDESENARRRRRLRGWTPEIPTTQEGGKLYVGERLELLESGMEQIRFDENPDDDEFVSVSTVQPTKSSRNGSVKEHSTNQNGTVEESSTHSSPTSKNGNEEPPSRHSQLDTTSQTATDETKSHFRDSETVEDSVRTEPIDDDP
jgi:WD40 repeat protein